MRGIVDDRTTGLGCDRRVGRRHGRSSRKQTDVRLAEVEFGQIGNVQFAALESYSLANGMLAGQCIDLSNWKVPLGKYLQHDLADGAGRAHNCNIEFSRHR